MIDSLNVLKYYLYYKYRRTFSDRKALEHWQSRKVKKHLQYVSRHSPLYRGMNKLNQYPITNKEFMMEHFSELNTAGIHREEAEQFAIQAERDRNFTPKLKGITVGLSSGTSGKRGIFLISDQEKSQWAGYILAKFLPDSIFSPCSIAFFMRADSNLYQAVNAKSIRLHFFDLYQDINILKKRLTKIQPQILVGQPSVLLMLAEEKNRNKLSINPRLIISIAEVLEKEDELRLKKSFGLEVIHQVYQCTEGCLAATCSYGTLHLNEDIVHIEREYLDEHRFIPIVTDFQRKAQFIIRYRLNDILVEKTERCPCQNPCLALEKIEGREDDLFSFTTPNGGEKQVFPDFIRRCLLFSDEFASESTMASPDYRVIQDENGKILIYANLTEAGKEQVREEFRRLAQEQGFILPEILFYPYSWERKGKLKRIQRKRPHILPQGGTNEDET